MYIKAKLLGKCIDRVAILLYIYLKYYNTVG